MIKFQTVLLIVVLPVIMPSCTGNSPVSSGTSFVPSQSLSSFKTYGWSEQRTVSLRDPSRNTAEARQWVESALESAFNGKGLSKSDAATADVLIGYGVGSRSMQSSQTFTESGEMTQSQRQESLDSGRSGTLYTDYELGRLLLTVTERKTGKVVYSGTSEAALLEDPSESRARARIQKATKEILKGWPRS